MEDWNNEVKGDNAKALPYITYSTSTKVMDEIVAGKEIRKEPVYTMTYFKDDRILSGMKSGRDSDKMKENKLNCKRFRRSARIGAAGVVAVDGRSAADASS
jgi:hypothetical protein